jgi:hypothetical protein
MRHPERLLLILLLVLCCVGCQALLYPFARAFGGRKESELEISRQAFAEMKTNIHQSSLVVFSPLVSNLQGEPLRGSDASTNAVEFLQRELSPSVAPATENPDIPFEPMHHNQLRYETQRGRIYAAWVGSHHPAGDHFLFAEIIKDAAGHEIVGGQLFVVDAAGRIAYARHFNSHGFDPASMPNVNAFLDWMLKMFLQDLEEDPLVMFPRYGVG